MLTNVRPGSVPTPNIYIRDSLYILPNTTGDITLKLEIKDPIPSGFTASGYTVMTRDTNGNDASYYMAITQKSYDIYQQTIAGDLMFPSGSRTGYDGCVRLADGGRIPPNIGRTW